MSNSISVRLPTEAIRELDRIAGKQKKTRGVIAKEMLLRVLDDEDRWSQIQFCIQQLDARLEDLTRNIRLHASPDLSPHLVSTQQSVDQLRAALATVVYRLMIERGENETEVANWVAEIFGVQDSTASEYDSAGPQ
ncbi:MAG: hypothetical protein KDA87_03870 [Planctomycetales bacterium]|nr:hypothetical protein [Planctomycetales bacterium]